MVDVDVKQRTILFLIADTGAGHRSAANAINNAIKLISQQEQEEGAPPITYRVEIVDVFEEYTRFPLREAVKLYGPTIRYNPKLFGEVFHLTNRNETVIRANTLADPLIHNGLLRLITTVQPDVIVSIHPLLNYPTIKALRDLNLGIPFLTVVTDLISIHYSWFAPGADSYIVPTEQARQIGIKRGLSPAKVQMLGMPIDPKFTREVDAKEELQKRFGLNPGLPVILLVGGGDGAGGLQAAVRAISQARLPVQLLIVTGRNRRLYAHLQRTRASLHVPAKVFGFVQNMPELMHAADVIVTKAGPGTICEALACGLPIVLSGYVPGQEEGNVEFVVTNKVGTMARDTLELVDALRKLIKPGSPQRRREVENANKISQPRSSFSIASHILSYLPEPEEKSIWQTARWQLRQQMLAGRLRSAFRLRRFRRRLPRPLLNSPVMRRISHLRMQGLSRGVGPFFGNRSRLDNKRS